MKNVRNLRPAGHRPPAERLDERGRSRYLASVHAPLTGDIMSDDTQQYFEEVRRRLGPTNTNAMEQFYSFMTAYQRDVQRVSVWGVEDSAADVIADAIIGPAKGRGFAVTGKWDEISGLLMTMWGYPVVLDHDRIATELEALEGAALAQAYRAHVAWLTSLLGAQPEPHEIPLTGPLGRITQRILAEGK